MIGVCGMPLFYMLMNMGGSKTHLMDFGVVDAGGIKDL